MRGHGGLFDKLEGGSGKDKLEGGGGPDLLIGGAGRDRLNGGTWPDTLFGGRGKDVLLGGPGADLLDGGGSADVMRGNGGADTVTYVTRRKPVDVTLSRGQRNDGEQGEKDHITSTENAIGGIGDDHLAGYAAVNRLFGSAGDDKLTGLAGNDVLNGGPGKDTLQGDCEVFPVPAGFCDETGDDALQGDSGDDKLFGDKGKDKLLGEVGDDYLLGAEGDDDLQGGEGADVLWGDNGGRSSQAGNGADKLSGGDGDDELKGDDGDDTLDDGPGNDDLVGADGNDRLLSDPLGSDKLSGDGGVDTLDLSDRTQDLKITIGVGGRDDGQAGENDQTESATEIFLTGSGSDVIEDNWDVQNSFETGAGNDTVYARRDTDTMNGGEGIDTLSYAPFETTARIYFAVIDRRVRGQGRAASTRACRWTTTFSGFERFVGGESQRRDPGRPVLRLHRRRGRQRSDQGRIRRRRDPRRRRRRQPARRGGRRQGQRRQRNRFPVRRRRRRHSHRRHGQGHLRRRRARAARRGDRHRDGLGPDADGELRERQRLRAVAPHLTEGPTERFPAGPARTQPLMASAARFAISSGDTSSTWVATLQRCPKGSSNWPERSP